MCRDFLVVDMNILQYLFFFLFLLSIVEAKDETYTIKDKKAIKFYESSLELQKKRLFPEALEMLNNALKRDPSFVEAHLRIASIYQVLVNQEKSLFHYSKVIELAPDNANFSPAWFAIGQHYYKNGHYDSAKLAVNKYLSFRQSQKNKYVKMAQKIAHDCDFAIEAIKHPIPFESRPIDKPINQMPLQYFPVLTVDQNQLIFTGRQGFRPTNNEDIYISKKNEDGTWGIPESLSPNINTENNEGTCTISADGRILIFTSCLGRKGYGSCDLYISIKSGDQWSKPQNLGSTVNGRSWESQPSLSADGRTLFFVSDRVGGFGSRDIWVSKLNEQGMWSEPINAGGNINTTGDDISPFIHVNGKNLYFSSNGHVGMGGYDIYESELDQNGWSKAKNLGYPINTYHDQVSLFISGDGEKAYYSYEQKSGMKYNFSYLYEFDVPDEIKIKKKSSFVKGIVYDKETNKRLAASVELIDIDKNVLIAKVDADSITGEYFMVLTQGAQYALYANKEGYLFKSLSFDYKKLDNKDQSKTIDIYLSPIKSGSEVVLNNIFFDSDKYDLKEKSKTELDRLVEFLKINPSTKVEISGHTDNVGKAAYNKTLSLNRAKSVYEYLRKAGIEDKRMNYDGFGFEKPIAPNDIEANRKQNRRIEFKILE